MLPAFSPTTWQVLTKLAPNPRRKLHLREIVRQVGKGPYPVERALHKLDAVDLVNTERVSNRVYYQINRAHPLYRGIRQITAHYLELPPKEQAMLNDFVNRLKGRLGANLKQVILYGSKARGDWHSESDIDIAVLVGRNTNRTNNAIITIASDVMWDHNYPGYLHPYAVPNKLFDEPPHWSFVYNLRKDGIYLN